MLIQDVHISVIETLNTVHSFIFCPPGQVPSTWDDGFILSINKHLVCLNNTGREFNFRLSHDISYQNLGDIITCQIIKVEPGRNVFLIPLSHQYSSVPIQNMINFQTSNDECFISDEDMVMYMAHVELNSVKNAGKQESYSSYVAIPPDIRDRLETPNGYDSTDPMHVYMVKHPSSIPWMWTTHNKVAPPYWEKMYNIPNMYGVDERVSFDRLPEPGSVPTPILNKDMGQQYTAEDAEPSSMKNVTPHPVQNDAEEDTNGKTIPMGRFGIMAPGEDGILQFRELINRPIAVKCGDSYRIVYPDGSISSEVYKK